jgi:hypothetical protein
VRRVDRGSGALRFRGFWRKQGFPGIFIGVPPRGPGNPALERPMKKIKLDFEKLQIQSFTTGVRKDAGGTVRAHSGDQIMSPSDWNPLDCAPSGVDTGSMCGCGAQGPSGYPQSCVEATCIDSTC